MAKIKKLKDVVRWRLCIGCGACAYYCEQGAVALEHRENEGILPRFIGDSCGDCDECLAFCPGFSVAGSQTPFAAGTDGNMDLVGPVLEVWQGMASDEETRFKASSGGLLTALSRYCLEERGMSLVLHTGRDPEKPWFNRTVVSRNISEMLENTGSRYSPSSPCDNLSLIESADRPCVFIGKPCDVAAVNQLRKIRKELDEKLGLVLAFVCAGTPFASATLSFLDKMGLDRDEVVDIRYRGHGWPGLFTATTSDGARRTATYKESWGFLARQRRPFRCMLCPDGLGELSDITCADAWSMHNERDGNEGLSLAMVRTMNGRDILEGARTSGYVDLIISDIRTVLESQGLVQRRAVLFGRILARRLLGIPAPRFPGFNLFASWKRVPVMGKLRSIAGTFKRIFLRKMYLPDRKLI
jgi:coenzyme F420 hydrogenase subunit beta